jgi:hypothetical protein
MLGHIAGVLEKEGMEVLMQEDESLDWTSVVIGADSQQRSWVLNLSAAEQLLPKEAYDENTIGSGLWRLQLEVQLPFEVEVIYASQLASTIAFVNRMLELPGFELDEAGGRLYFRTIYMLNEQTFDKRILLALIGMIVLILEMFSDLLERVAGGALTYLELMDMIVNLSEEGKPHA